MTEEEGKRKRGKDTCFTLVYLSAVRNGGEYQVSTQCRSQSDGRLGCRDGLTEVVVLGDEGCESPPRKLDFPVLRRDSPPLRQVLAHGKHVNLRRVSRSTGGAVIGSIPACLLLSALQEVGSPLPKSNRPLFRDIHVNPTNLLIQHHRDMK